MRKAVSEMEYSTDKCKDNINHVMSYCNSCGTCHDCLESGIKSLQKELAEIKEKWGRCAYNCPTNQRPFACQEAAREYITQRQSKGGE